MNPSLIRHVYNIYQATGCVFKQIPMVFCISFLQCFICGRYSKIPNVFQSFSVLLFFLSVPCVIDLVKSQMFYNVFLYFYSLHRSALYVVDLVKFRRIAAGDRLRGQYQALSQDPNSLSNLDQVSKL